MIIEGISKVKMTIQKQSEEKRADKTTPKEVFFEPKHSVKTCGKGIKYTVITGIMILEEKTVDREKEMNKDLTEFIKDASYHESR
jgi:hypothetical protein